MNIAWPGRCAGRACIMAQIRVRQTPRQGISRLRKLTVLQRTRGMASFDLSLDGEDLKGLFTMDGIDEAIFPSPLSDDLA